MAKIVIACNKKPLAAFIEMELNGDLVDCRIALNAASLMTLVAEFKPDILLFEAEFPTLAESPALLGNLQTESPQIPIIGIIEPVGENRDEVGPDFSPANILRLPFSGDDLCEKVQQIAGLEIKKRPVPPEEEEEKEMDKPQSATVEIFELTEIVEEGLPLDELPEIAEGETPGVLLEVDSGKADTAGPEPDGEAVEDLELDGFGDTMDDLESVFGESEDAGFDAVVENGAEVTPESEKGVESEARETSSELVAGDIDALLVDDDFTEVEIPEKLETHDPVLAELKSAGLTPEGEVVVTSTSKAVASPTPELKGENDFGEEELGDIDDFLDETSVSHTPEPAESLAAAVVPEEIFTAESPDAEIELPEDYLLDEEVPAAGVEPEPEPGVQALSSAPPLKLELEEPEVCAEPISPDFSRQIESMTQEWSKQLLQTTYASMDKMIKAIGDLAPTIVDQVAREVIPPLAEKVIKAEIARLEEKLESEEDQEEISDS